MSSDSLQARPWRKALAIYQTPNLVRSTAEIALTAVPLTALWTAAWIGAALDLWWLAALLTIPAAGFLVRLFMILHDCSHHAFFRGAALNDWIGRIIGVFTLTPYDCWRQTHAIHHATSGDLDRRGFGEVATLTVNEYRALPPMRRLAYRLYRHPLVIFGLGPSYLFLIQHRWPSGLMRRGWRPWLSAMATNSVIAGLIAAAIWLHAWETLLLIHLPTLLLAASIGVWLFFIQHQFEASYWARHNAWNATDAALRGSSYYDLPSPLRWMSANIGIHHVHHLDSRIPFYRLPRVLRDFPELKGFGRMNLLGSIRCIGLSLWDESRRRLISFADFRQDETRRAPDQCWDIAPISDAASRASCAGPGAVSHRAR